MHLLRANGYAPNSDISKQHKDIEDSLRMREGAKWGEGQEFGRSLNNPKAYKEQRQRNFEFNLISNTQSIAKNYL